VIYSRFVCDLQPLVDHIGPDYPDFQNPKNFIETRIKKAGFVSILIKQFEFITLNHVVKSFFESKF
jgi:hypothetical protein